jgi:hypothetical protein
MSLIIFSGSSALSSMALMFEDTMSLKRVKIPIFILLIQVFLNSFALVMLCQAMLYIKAENVP